MEAVSVAKAPAFDIVGKTQLSPKAWLDAVYTRGNPSNNLSVSQWQGVRDALSSVFRPYDGKNHALFDSFNSAVNALKENKAVSAESVLTLQSHLNNMAEADGYELQQIQFANALRDRIFGPAMAKEVLTARELEKLVTGCLLVSEEMGFYPEQIEHAKTLMREIQDTSTVDHAGRIQIALTAVHCDYNYGYVGPTEIRKGYNHLTSGVSNFICSFWS